MAEYLSVVRRALGQLGGHGGVRGFLLQLLRVNDVKTGALIGVDKYGNKYYEDKKNYFFGRHRWVIYTKEMNGKKTLWEVDGSMVPAEWHRWLHCMTDDPPTTHPPEPKKFLAEVHQFNVSGTSQQYVPYSTTRKKLARFSMTVLLNDDKTAEDTRCSVSSSNPEPAARPPMTAGWPQIGSPPLTCTWWKEKECAISLLQL